MQKGEHFDMAAVFTLLIIAAIAAGAIVFAHWYSRRHGKAPTPDVSGPMADLGNPPLMQIRDKILQGKPEDFGITQLAGKHQVWGVLMETGYPKGSCTLLTTADGNASLYFGTGGGVIGGYAHQEVRNAARNLSDGADHFVEGCVKTTSFPIPGTGDVIFNILTKDGAYTAGALEKELGEKRHPLSPLFYAGHAVITQLRLVSERLQKGEQPAS
jgi:hypothetical protein